MALTEDLIQQFVKATKDETAKPTESISYGTIVKSDGKTYVQLDGSTIFTPVSSTIVVEHGDRVMVTNKDHALVVTGNLTDPSASNDKVNELDKNVNSRIDEFDIILADKVSTEDLNVVNATIQNLQATDITISGKLEAAEGKIESLEADNVVINDTLKAHKGEFDTIDATFANIDGELKANAAKIEDLEATNADFRKLEADYADFKNATVEDFSAVNGKVENLSADHATFKEATAENFTAVNGKIENLNADYAEFKEATVEDLEAVNATIETLDASYATIDFSNIGEAAVEKLFADSGIIKELVMNNGSVTGELVGVTIKGDLIEGNTIKAEKLVVKGKDGLYYKLNIEGGALTSEDVTEEQLQNGLSGSVIIAKSVTADKVHVTDLVAFGATIGGFEIDDNAIHTITKASVDNTLPGIYMDNIGQFAVGDDQHYLKYYRDENGKYRLDVSAASVRFATSSGDSKSLEEVIDEATDIQIGTRNLIRNSENLIFADYSFGKVRANVLGSGKLGQIILGYQ